jgi:NADPH-dependent 2,4-dienoyl-CoA reductase/sulfur reductase-like enzyme
VTLIDPLSIPMSRALNLDAGAYFTAKYEAEGVETRFGVSVEALAREGDELVLSLTDQSVLRADCLLLGIGAQVNTEWLEGSGITTENGVVCDGTLAAVGVADVYAVGDVARWTNRTLQRSHRLEHWTNAADQARLVAHNILHPDDARDYHPVEYVWSDQYDWKIQIVGKTGSEDAHLIGDPNQNRFALLYGRHDLPLEGAVVVNWPRALIDARRSVAAGAPLADIRARLTEQASAAAGLAP